MTTGAAVNDVHIYRLASINRYRVMMLIVIFWTVYVVGTIEAVEKEYAQIHLHFKELWLLVTHVRQRFNSLFQRQVYICVM